jgi:hypothetical protein
MGQESDMQTAFFEWVALKAKSNNAYEMIIATPNEGGKNMHKWGNKRKAEGMAPGFPDISVFIPRSGFAGLFIELKTKKNTATETQKKWNAKLNHWGYCCICLRTDYWERLADIVANWIERGVVPAGRKTPL